MSDDANVPESAIENVQEQVAQPEAEVPKEAPVVPQQIT